MKPWEIYWATIQFEDSNETKRRPILIISNNQAIQLGCKITSNLSRPQDYEYKLIDWKAAGLDKPSVVRLTKRVIPTVPMTSADYIGEVQQSDKDNIMKICKDNNLDIGDLGESLIINSMKESSSRNVQRMGDKIVEFPRGTVAPEYIWNAVCNNRFKVVKNYFESGKEPNKRYPRFGKMHSLIMGALRNGNEEMVDLLQSYGETILPEEQDEYDEIMKHIDRNGYDESLKEEQSKLKEPNERLFSIGDRVKYVNNDGWSQGGEKYIGKTGTIVKDGWQGLLQTFSIEFDEPIIPKIGYPSYGTLAHPNNIELLENSLKEEQSNELYDGKNYEYNGLSFTLWFDESTNRYLIACDDIIEDKTDTPAYVGNLSPHKTDEDVMRLIKDRYDELIGMIGKGLHKYRESLDESNLEIPDKTLKHTHDGTLTKDSVIYTITVFKKANGIGDRLLWHNADDAYDEIYFDTADEAKKYADKNYPDAESITIRKEEMWDKNIGATRLSSPYMTRKNGEWVTKKKK